MNYVFGSFVMLLCVSVTVGSLSDVARVLLDPALVLHSQAHKALKEHMNLMHPRVRDMLKKYEVAINCENGHEGKCRFSKTRALFGLYKFCPTGSICMGRKCCKVERVEEKAGQCPAVENKIVLSRKLCSSFCRDNSDCGGTSLCCSSGCHKYCTAPVLDEEEDKEGETEEGGEGETEDDLGQESGDADEDEDKEQLEDEVEAEAETEEVDLAILEEALRELAEL